MWTSARSVRVWVVAMAAFLLHGDPSYAEPMLMGLGDLTGGDVSSHAAAISADGTVVVGHSSSELGSAEAFRWSAIEGMLPLGDIEGGPFQSRAVGVSDDGSVIVGVGVNDESSHSDESFLWTSAGGLRRLGGIAQRADGGSYGSVATAISGDGAIVVGSAHVYSSHQLWQQAFQWSEAEGMTSLGVLQRSSGGTSEALAVSNSESYFRGGPMIVGRSDSYYERQAFWKLPLSKINGMTTLSGVPLLASSATAVSSSGRIAAGWSITADGSYEAFRNVFGRGPVGLGRDLGPTCTQAAAISGDGTVIVGHCEDDQRPWIWTEANGMRWVADELSRAGVDTTGWTLQRAVDVADDGLTLVGWGVNPNGQQESWIATLPEQARLEIDILPGSPDPQNSTVHGVIPVAILGSDEIDVTTLDVTSLTFGPNGTAPVHEQYAHVEDVNDDGQMDLVSHYNTEDAGIFDSDPYGEACVWVTRHDGRRLRDCDRVALVPTTFLETDNVASAAAVLVAVGDLDGDGDPDVVAALETSQTLLGPGCGGGSRYFLHDIVWYENENGRGLFSAANLIQAAATEVSVLELGDLDADGDLDLVVGTVLDRTLAWLPNIDGLGNFGPAQLITNDIDAPRRVELADFDGDGDLDVLWSRGTRRECIHTDGKVGWFENLDGGGLSFSSETLLIPFGGFDLDVRDIDGDGDLDVIFRPGFTQRLGYLDNSDGNGSFAEIELGIYVDCDWPFLVDLDLDGDTDFVCPETWYENLGNVDGTLHLNRGGETGGVPENGPRAVAFDVELDGDVDYVVAGFIDNVALGDYNYGLGIQMLEREVDPDVPEILVPGLYQPSLGVFTGPAYLDPDEPDYLHDRVITQTFAVDVDMDTDLDLILVAGVTKQIYWFENSLLTPEPTVPVAAAGDDQLVIVGDTAYLDGTASRDPEFDPLTHLWTIISAPAGSGTMLDDADTALPSLVPDTAGVFEIQLIVSDLIGSSPPDAVEITAVTAQSFAETHITQAATIVLDLGPDQVTTKGNQNALGRFLRKVIADIRRSRLRQAIHKLERAIGKTDGCASNGAPDGRGRGRDWITDCAAQAQVHGLLLRAVDALNRPSLNRRPKSFHRHRGRRGSGLGVERGPRARH